MTSTSELFRICHFFFGIRGPTNTVFGLTQSRMITQGDWQTWKKSARHFDMSKVVMRRGIYQKFKLYVIFHFTFFNWCLSVIVLMVNNELTYSDQNDISYKKYL